VRRERTLYAERGPLEPTKESWEPLDTPRSLQAKKKEKGRERGRVVTAATPGAGNVPSKAKRSVDRGPPVTTPSRRESSAESQAQPSEKPRA
jgi:hypothetical protein